MSAFVLSPQGIYRSPALLAFDELEHGFGTSFSAGWPPSAARLKQVHGDVCHRAVSAADAVREGDALIASEAGTLVSVRTADCIPVLLYDPANQAWGAVHAGWRGTASMIAAKVVARMQQEFGSKPAGLVAAIGPGIGPCCFEVGEEVAEYFPDFTNRDLAKPRVDLWLANRAQLERAGAGQIEVAGLCTCCLADRFHSYRRDKGPGRMVSVIGRRSIAVRERERVC